jgi:hypothetical protein
VADHPHCAPSILVGSGLLVWQHRHAAGASAAERPPAAGFAAVALELDSEAAAVLRLMRAYVDAQERYSVALAQADQRLPSVATPEEIGIICQVPDRRECAHAA